MGEKEIAGDVGRDGKGVGDWEWEYEMRTKKLEEKLLTKAEVVVRSAAGIWEREVIRTVDFEE